MKVWQGLCKTRFSRFSRYAVNMKKVGLSIISNFDRMGVTPAII
jgi:hypothetical protein